MAGETLTPLRVAEAAADLVGAEGEGSLTMRRLGELLGVKAMALYNHYPDKEALLDAAASLAFARLPAPSTKGPWKARVKAVCRGVREMAHANPHLFRLAMTRRTPPAASLPQIEALLSALADAGLAPAAQATVYHTLRLFVRAFCLWEIEEPRADRSGGAAALLGAAAAYPRTSAAGRALVDPDPDRQFEACIDLILRGVEPAR